MNNKNLSIVQVASGDLWAGAETQLYTLCSALKKIDKTKLNVILLNHGTLERKLKEIDINVHVIDENKYNAISIIIKLIKLFFHIKPEIVHTHRIKENILAGIASLVIGAKSIRSVHGAQEHASGWSRPHKKLMHFTDWLIGRYIQTYIISVSEDLAKTIEKSYPVSKVKIIENGIDYINLEKMTRDKSNLKNETPYKIGIIGRLVPVKRIDLFINIAISFHNLHPDIDSVFYIYGDGPLKEKLIDYYKNSNTNQKIIFCGHSNNIHKDISNLDAILVTSDHEGLPMTVLEAMSIKTPLICHSVGGITKALDSGNNGILINNQNPDEYANAIEYVFNNKEATNTRLNNALNTIINNYSAETNAEKYFNIYKLALNI